MLQAYKLLFHFFAAVDTYFIALTHLQKPTLSY